MECDDVNMPVELKNYLHLVFINCDELQNQIVVSA